jgi:hypothetical protein
MERDGRAIASNDLTNIKPCSWLFHQGKLYPYEYKRGQGFPEPPMDLVNELGAILQDIGLCDVMGLQVYEDGVVGMETTDFEGRVSTTKSYPEGTQEFEKDPNVITASFAFFYSPAGNIIVAGFMEDFLFTLFVVFIDIGTCPIR